MRVLLAVSGGIDSMYLANKAPELFPEASFAIAHCNFALRGEESDGDESFVRDWCAERGIPFFVKRFDTKAYAESQGISTEMAARDLRYAWFEELCSARGFDAVAVAHNANDNAETLILNLLRGTGSKGLRGMGERKLGGRTMLLRPLLGTTREEIAAWMKANEKKWREDSTNAANLFKRNKIRNEVFPVFAEINPSFLKTISEDIRHFSQVDDIAEDYFQDMAMSVWVAGTDNSISIPSLKSLKHWDYILYRLLSTYGFGSATVEALCSLLRSDGTLSGKTFEAPGWKLVTSSDRLMILPSSETEVEPAETGLSITGPGEYPFLGRTLTVKVFDRPEGMALRQHSGTMVADAASLPFPLGIRRWQAGDWMMPLGLGGSKKLSDLFVDLKWSLPRKENALVLEHPDGRKGHVGALLCERIDEAIKVTDKTVRILQIILS